MSEAPDVNPQEVTDREHLKLLAIFYYILRGITILFSAMGVFHLAFGLAMVFFPEVFDGQKGNPPPAFMGYIFACAGGVFVLGGWTLGGLTLLAGRSIQRCKRRLFTLVVAGLSCVNCMFMPFGAVLGVFTFVVLSRPSVQRLYESQAA